MTVNSRSRYTSFEHLNVQFFELLGGYRSNYEDSEDFQIFSAGRRGPQSTEFSLCRKCFVHQEVHRQSNRTRVLKETEERPRDARIRRLKILLIQLGVEHTVIFSWRYRVFQSFVIALNWISLFPFLMNGVTGSFVHPSQNIVKEIGTKIAIRHPKETLNPRRFDSLCTE